MVSVRYCLPTFSHSSKACWSITLCKFIVALVSLLFILHPRSLRLRPFTGQAVTLPNSSPTSCAVGVAYAPRTHYSTKVFISTIRGKNWSRLPDSVTSLRNCASPGVCHVIVRGACDTFPLLRV